MALAIDQIPAIVRNIASSVTTGTFSTGNASEIVIAIAASDGFFTGNTQFSISDSLSNTYTFIARHNTISGSIEAWYTTLSATQSNMTVTATNAFGSNDNITLQVITLSGQYSSPIGATTGSSITSTPITINLSTTGDNSYVFAAYSNSAVNPYGAGYTADTGQSMIGQSTPGGIHGGAAMWRQTSLTTNHGTSVTMDLSAPTSGYGDIIAFEILSTAPQVTPNFSVSDSSSVTESVTIRLDQKISISDSSTVTESVSTTPLSNKANVFEASSVSESIAMEIYYPVVIENLYVFGRLRLS